MFEIVLKLIALVVLVVITIVAVIWTLPPTIIVLTIVVIVIVGWIIVIEYRKLKRQRAVPDIPPFGKTVPPDIAPVPGPDAPK